MRKRSRRGKGKGKKAATPTPSLTPTEEVVPPITISTSGSIDTSSDQVFSNSNADSGSTETSSYGAVTDSTKSDSNELNEYNLRKLAVTQQSDGTLILRSSNRIASTGSQSSGSTNCSVDGDGDGAGSDTTGDNESNEPLHTGFMQTGPNCYRAGSTVVNLNNCSEEDVTATFKDNDICLEVECGDNKGSMFMSKLYQGSKGKCIESKGAWYTPNEFQVMSGRGSAKDWKRSIRHQGRSLKLLLSKDVLDVHPAACRCDSCRQLEIMNGKSTGGTNSSTVDPSKSGSGGDTSGEDSNKRGLFNGSTAKKRKKGRPPSSANTGPAAKTAKITSSSVPGSTSTPPTETPTATLEPVSITIPAPSPVPEEDKMVPLPNLDSPLFKDVPSKKDSSSDSSSSGSSSSDDSSSSEEDSDDEENKKESSSPVTMDAIPTKADPPSLAEASTPKARTPIKLTISNVGKPSAKVTSSSSRDLLESNSSDSEWDNDDSNNGKKVNDSEAKELFSSSLKEASSPLRWKPVSLNPTSEGDVDNSVSSKLWENSPTPVTDSNCNASQYEDVEQAKFDHDASVVKNANSNSVVVGVVDNPMAKSDDSINSGYTSPIAAGPTQDLLNHVVSVTTTSNQNVSTPVKGSTGCENSIVSLPEDKDKSFDEDSLLKEEEDISIDSGLKNLDEDFLLKDDVDNVGDFSCDERKDKTCESDKKNVDNDISSKDSSENPNHGVLDLDYDSMSNNKDSKYCPDGFILAPTLSKSPDHLRSPLKYGCHNGNLLPDVEDSENVTDVMKSEIVTEGEQNIPSQNCVDNSSLLQHKRETNEKSVVNSLCFINDANEVDKDIPQKVSITKEDSETLQDILINKNENKEELDCENKATAVLEPDSPKEGESSEDAATTVPSSPSTLTPMADIPSTNLTTATPSSLSEPSSPSSTSAVATDSTSAVTADSKIPTNGFENQLSVITSDANKNQSLSSPSSPPPSSSSSTAAMSSPGPTISSVTSPIAKSSSLPSTTSVPTTSVSETILSTPSCSASSPTPSNSSTTTSTTASTKQTACTNGIPDKENPFITWTKYDDDTGPIDSHLPPSSLVQALARSPFPPLPLPSNAPGSQISPLRSSVPQLSPLGLSGISPTPQIPHLASPGSQQRAGMSPSQGSPGSSTSQSGRLSASIEGKGSADQQNKQPVQKSAKRSSRLSNIIDSLRSSKEKQISTTPAPKEPPAQEQPKRSALDALFGLSQSAAASSANLSSSSSSSSHPKPSSHSPAPSASIVPPLLSSSKDPSLRGSEKIHQDSLILPSQVSTDTRQAIRSSLDAARAQAVNESFNALKDDLDKGKRILENLELMKNGLLDSPYGKQPLIPDQKQQRSRVDSSSASSSQLNRGRASSSTPTTAPSSSSSLPRPSSRQSSKLPNSNQQQSHSSSSSSSSMSTSLPSASKSSSSNMAPANSMYQAAPSAALTAAHMELNAAAANIMAMQHMYGMQDPYFMKALMSNPLYLQRMMEFQKQAMDPMMLRQLEMLEAAALADKTKNSKDQRAALNAQNLLWSAQAATMLQHQQMQQLQQIQLHHQQQQQMQQQQAVAAKEKESLDTIAALMANKSNNFHNSSSSSSKGINSGSISTGQSSKFVAPSSSSSPASSVPNNKRPRSNAPTPTLPSNSYSREAALSAEKKARLQSSSHHQSNSSSSYSNSSSSSSLSSSSTPSRSSSSHPSNKQTGNTSSSAGSSSSRLMYPTTKQDYQDLQAQLNASAAAAGLWGMPPGMTPQQQMDMVRMTRYFEQQQQQQHHQQQKPQQRQREGQSSSSNPQRSESEAVVGAEVLDLSVKPRSGKV